MRAAEAVLFISRHRRGALIAAVSVLSAFPCAALAQQAAGANLPLIVGQGAGGTSYSVPIQTLLFFTALSFLPAVLLLMTGFTRIVIVLSLLRQRAVICVRLSSPAVSSSENIPWVIGLGSVQLRQTGRSRQTPYRK